MSDYITKAQCERIRVEAFRKANDDAIERCARLMFEHYQNAPLAVEMTRQMADGPRAIALNAEFLTAPSALDKLTAENQRLGLYDDESPTKQCECFACITDRADPRFFPVFTQMLVCATCGNKRCPHANNHRFACTGSNAPGQHGSRYP